VTASTSPRDADIELAHTIDTWIIAVLRRAGVRVHVFSDASIGLVDVPAKWSRVVDALSAGIHAVARGEELPEIAPEEGK
jgi:hypothetical protein